MEKIATAKDVTEKQNCKSHAELIKRMSAKMFSRGVIKKAYSGKKAEDAAVYARIDFGRWLADCECGGAEYVDPEDDTPLFFCFSCGNEDHKGHARPVIFPDSDEREQIESALLQRSVGRRHGFIDMPAKGHLPRSWSPGVSAQDLLDENEYMSNDDGI